MKLNKKGFTLVELLAAVTILGILMGAAVAGVTSAQRKSRQKAYEAMESSAFAAAQNYIQEKNSVVPTSAGFDEFTPAANLNSIITNTDKVKEITTHTLVTENLLPELKDPKTKGNNCHGSVYVTKVKGSGNKLDSYAYLVEIKCQDYTSTHKVKNTGETARGKVFLS